MATGETKIIHLPERHNCARLWQQEYGRRPFIYILMISFRKTQHTLGHTEDGKGAKYIPYSCVLWKSHVQTTKSRTPTTRQHTRRYFNKKLVSKNNNGGIPSYMPRYAQIDGIGQVYLTPPA